METIKLSLDDLMAFHLVAAAGGFTRAAEQGRSSKALLSKQVKRLESTLRARLFHRTTRQLHLTEAGAALFSHASRIFEISQEAGQAVRSTTENSPIRISMPISFGEFFGPGFLHEMKRSLPGARIELDLANENRDFRRDQLDFAIRATEDHHQELVARKLGVLRDVICAAPGTRAPATPMGLAKLDCILHSQNRNWNTWLIRRGERGWRVRVEGPYSTNQYPTMKALCLAGLGIARIPYYLVKEELQSGRLLELFPEHSIATHPLYLVHLKSEYAPRRLAFARERILEWFRKQVDIFVS